VVHAAAKKQRGDASSRSVISRQIGVENAQGCRGIGWQNVERQKGAKEFSLPSTDPQPDRPSRNTATGRPPALMEVRPLEGAEIPSVDDGYRVSALPRVSPDVVGNPLACAIKTATVTGGLARCGACRMCRGNIVRDAIRVITGNLTGYKLMHDPHVFQDDQGRAHTHGRMLRDIRTRCRTTSPRRLLTRTPEP